MQQIDQFKVTYFQECDELLGKLEGHLSEIARLTGTAEDLNAAFRAIHSIKGGAAMFGFKRLVQFAHIFESALDALRSGRIEVNSELIEKALQATDILADLAASARTGEFLPEEFEGDARENLEQAFLGVAAGNKAQTHDKLDIANPGYQAQLGPATFHICFEPPSDMLRRAIDPLVLVRNLAALGQLETKVDASKLPSFAEVDPAVSYLSWSFELVTSAPLQSVRDVFEFVSDSCKLEISVQEAAAIDAAAVEAAFNEIPAAKLPAASRPPKERIISSIRVDLDRVERLVDLVGEITIAQAMVLQHLDQSMINSNSELFRALSQLLQHSRNLQDGVMSIRAQPIGSIFSRMPRVAREVAQQTGRAVDIVLSGEETEIDKTIIEQLSDPLVHIVRNSIDHGIESAEERRAAGKNEVGTVKLSAAQRGGRIVVEVSDDGRGINRHAVRQRAIQRNLISSDVELTDEEVNNLIFSPGLSTAQSVTGISGRGVGMDVVYKNIQKLGGRVTVLSQPGAGTTTTITLPLTLAVLEGMLVRAGCEQYLIPLNNIVECLVIPPSDLKPVAGASDMINVRGQQIPVFDLAQHLGLAKAKAKSNGRVQVVLTELEGGGVCGVIVDEICGHNQVVIKSIRQNFRDLPGIAGATILGDGNVALILDVTQMARIASTQRTKQVHSQRATAQPEIQAA